MAFCVKIAHRFGRDKNNIENRDAHRQCFSSTPYVPPCRNGPSRCGNAGDGASSASLQRYTLIPAIIIAGAISYHLEIPAAEQKPSAMLPHLLLRRLSRSPAHRHERGIREFHPCLPCAGCGCWAMAHRPRAPRRLASRGSIGQRLPGAIAGEARLLHCCWK